MTNEPFQHEYDLASLIQVHPRGQGFAMYVTPRYRHHYEIEAYERYTARLVERIAARHSLFLDIGANYGFYTLLAATRHPGLEVIALEPVPETFAALERSAEALRLRNVQLRQLAAADADGTASFHIAMAADNCGFYPHPHAPPLRRVTVNTARVDTLLAGRTPCPTLIKIDVDGHELAIFRGMADVFARFPDLSLIVEFNPKMQSAAGAQPEDLLRELDRLGFALFLLDDTLYRPGRLAPDADWTQWLEPAGYANLYCVRKERALSVCFFSHSAQLAGAERSLLELVDELVADHGVVCSVVLPGAGPLEEAMVRVGAAPLRAGCGWWCAPAPPTPPGDALARLQPRFEEMLRGLLPDLARIDPDLVWTQTMVIPWGAAAASLLGKPHVWSVCEYGERDHGLSFFAPFSRVLEDILSSSALVYTAIRGIGEALFAGAPAGHWRPLDRHIPIPPPPPHPAPTNLFLRPGAVRLGLFATVQESKGQEDAVRAVGLLAAEGREVELLLAGDVDAGYRRRLETLLAQLGLRDRVRLPGFLAEPFAAMREADIILVCSRCEAFGRTAVEAMLLGKPIVYAMAGGLVEHLHDGRTGLGYPPGDAGALAAALRRLLTEPGLMAALGAAAREAAAARFTRDHYGGAVYRALRDLKARRLPGARFPALLRPLLVAALGQPAPGAAPNARSEEQEALLTERNAQVAWLTAQLKTAQAESDELRAAVASAEAWQERWLGRALHRWRRPGASRQPARPLRKLERSLRKRRKKLLAALEQTAAGRAFGRLAGRWSRRLAVLREALLSATVRMGWTPRRRRLRALRQRILDSGLFDPEWYRQQYPEVDAARADPVLHYLVRGAAAGCNPNPLFDTAWYAQQNPAAAGLNPLEHYCLSGAAAGRAPSPRFNPAWHLAPPAEPLPPGRTLLGHYLAGCRAAGWTPVADAGLVPSRRFADPRIPFAPEVTVVVPNYNHEPFLRRRLDSIYGQTYRHLQVLLLDDASTDGSREILREYAGKYPERTRLVCNDANSGCVFAQWNRGLELATTDLVWIAESDDFCERDFLEVLVPSFRDEAVQIAYCRTVFVGADDRPIDFSFEAYADSLVPGKWRRNYVETAHREVRTALGIRNTIPNVSSALLRHPGSLPLLQDPAWLAMRVCGDWLFYLHHARGGKIAYACNTASYYRFHPGNASRGAFRSPAFFREHEQVARTLLELYAVEPAILERQRQFLVEHWAFVFKEGAPPSCAFEDAYSPARARAAAAARLPNVLVATYDFTTGGGEIFAIRLAAALRERGFGVTFFDYDGQPPNPEFRRLLPPGVPVVQRQDHANPLPKVIEDFGIEIVHTHHGATDDYFATHLPANAVRPRHVVTMHGMYEAMDLGPEAAHLRKLVARVDHWVYVADNNLAPFKQHGLYDPERFTKGRIGVRRPALRPVRRDTLGLGADAFVVTVVSRALPEKGWSESIQAVAESRRRTGRDIHLLLIGQGPARDELARQELPPFVHLLGFKSNPLDYYAMSDLGLLASRYQSESYPTTLVECLMAGRPVVATDIGEVRSLLTAPGGACAGILVRLRDGAVPVNDLADAISCLVQDPAVYQRAVASVSAASAQSEMTTIVNQYAAVYSRVLAKYPMLNVQ